MQYRNELTRAMKHLAQDDKTIFLGQGIVFPGNGLYETLQTVSICKRIELPVAEDLQMGMSIGLSLEGFIPISIFPRMDFLILALNQLVNHLDKINKTSNCQFNPKVIIRTAIGATKPFYPGLQHCSDYTEGIKAMVKSIDVVKLANDKDIVPEYDKALCAEHSTLLIEYADLY